MKAKDSVLASIPSYHMSCFLWPKESLSTLEKLLRAFFWQGKNTVKGGHCLVAWHFATLPRSSGGLGIRDLSAHNQALLSKFAAKVLQSSDVPCFQWFAQQYCKHATPLKGSNRDTAIWKNFKPFIPTVLASSKCSTGPSKLISFWHDHWLHAGRLRFLLPALFSYAKDGACTMASQLCNDIWCIQLHPNLTATAAQELQMLQSILPPPPSNAAALGSDVRISAMHHKPLTTSQVYQLVTFRGVTCEFSSWVWDKIIPLRYHVFLWLAFRGRLNTKDNMVQKHWTLLTEHQDCDLCPASESASHIVLRCYPASVI